jgi:hypothetical protein
MGAGQPQTFPRPPGFFECRRAIEALTRFQNLARHYFPKQPDIQFAPPLEELLPAGTTQQQERWVLEQQINRLIPIVIIHLRRIGINSTVTGDELQEKDYLGQEMEKVSRAYDVVDNYLEMFDGRHGLQAHLTLMGLLERALGLYESRKKRALLEMFNPLNWIAELIRMPITVLERAGGQEASTGILKVYYWIFRIAFLSLVIFVAAKLGISIPWKLFFEHTP